MTKKNHSAFGKRVSISEFARVIRSSERLQANHPGLRIYIELSPAGCPGPGVSMHAIYNGRGVYFGAVMLSELKGKNAIAKKLQECVATVLAGGGNVL